MKIRCEYKRLVPLAELKEHLKNRNKHSADQIARLAQIFEYQGIRHPIIVSNLSGFIVAGHGRLAAAKKLGFTEFPVDYQDFGSEEEEYAFLVSDNSIALWAELDFSGINADLGDLGPDFDIDLLGIKNFEIEVADKDGLTDEDAIPEHVEPKTKLGDIYCLGNHRLMCGDSTSIDAVEKLMDGEKADMVFTDPPYGMHLDTDFSSMDGLRPDGTAFLNTKGGKVHEKVKGDHNDFTPELINTVFAAFPGTEEVFLWGADYYAEHIPNRNHGAWIVWDKRSNEGASSDQSASADKAIGSNFELCWSKQKHKRELARIRNGIFGVKNEAGNSKTVHPTQKPVQLAEWFFEKWGKAQDVVADLFGGSGSTLIACEKTNRKAYLMELDPKYCDVIVARWEAFTGQKAELLTRSERDG